MTSFEKSLSFCVKNFSKLVTEKEFLHMSKDSLLKIISNKNLSVPCESIIITGLTDWIKFDYVERSSSIDQLMSHVQFQQLPILKLIEAGRNEYIRGSKKLLELVEEAKDAFLVSYAKKIRRVISSRVCFVDVAKKLNASH